MTAIHVLLITGNQLAVCNNRCRTSSGRGIEREDPHGITKLRQPAKNIHAS